MSNHYFQRKVESWNRRQVLKLGLAGLGIIGTAVAFQSFLQGQKSASKIPPVSIDTPTVGNNINPMAMLRNFDGGTVKRENGRTVREFRLVAETSTIWPNVAPPAKPVLTPEQVSQSIQAIEQNNQKVVNATPKKPSA